MFKHRNKLNRRSGRRGFTLIEAVGTTIILAALGTVASNILLSGTDGYLDAATSSQMHAETSIGMDRIVRELRSIDLDDAAASVAPDIESVTASSITWHDSADSDYGFTLSGTDLMFQENDGAVQVLLTDVSEFDIQCFDESENALARSLTNDDCDDIRRVQITLTLTRHGISDTLRTRQFIRATMLGSDE